MTATLVPPPARPAALPPEPRGRVRGTGVLTPSLAVGVAVLLSSLALGPLFLESGWFGATLLVIVVVVTVGGLATAARLPVFLVPIAMAVALLSVLVARFTGDAPFGFVPTPDSLAELRQVLTQGTNAINSYAPPVPYSEGMAAITALGVGCVALTVFVLQVNLRMPTAAGAPLVALYVVPSIVLTGGSPWWAFVVVVVGWLILLVADERVGLMRWGRLLRRSDAVGGTRAVSGVSSAAFRLGATAILAALVLPVLVPGLADAVLGRNGGGAGGGDGAGGDGQSSTELGLSPLASLRRDLKAQSDTVMLTYTTTSKTPTYLRAVALETFDGESWKPRAFDATTPLAGGLPADGGVAADIEQSSAHYEVKVGALVSPYLPLPEHPTSVSAPAGDWFVDQGTSTVFAPSGDVRGGSWSVDAVTANPTPEQLRAAPDLETTSRAGLTADLKVPDNLADVLATVPGLQDATSSYDKALILQNWFQFTGGFSYDLTAKSDQSTGYLEQFLRDRKGYCEQFAATYALMARELGINSRVVVGFSPGAPKDGVYTVTEKNAHAWPELFFSGIGWVRFEPTPTSGARDVSLPTYAQKDSGKGGDEGGRKVIKPPSKTLPCTTRRDCDAQKAEVPQPPVDNASTSGVATSADTWRARVIGGLAVLALLAAAVPAAWRWLRRRRRLTAGAGVEDAWDELRDTARDLGVPWSDAQTPRQAVASVVASQRLTGEAADAATRIGRTTERSRYAPVAPATTTMAQDVTTVRAALLSRVELRGRLRAWLLPTSLRRSA